MLAAWAGTRDAEGEAHCCGSLTRPGHFVCERKKENGATWPAGRAALRSLVHFRATGGVLLDVVEDRVERGRLVFRVVEDEAPLSAIE